MDTIEEEETIPVQCKNLRSPSDLTKESKNNNNMTLSSDSFPNLQIDDLPTIQDSFTLLNDTIQHVFTFGNNEYSFLLNKLIILPASLDINQSRPLQIPHPSDWFISTKSNTKIFHLNSFNNALILTVLL